MVFHFKFGRRGGTWRTSSSSEASSDGSEYSIHSFFKRRENKWKFEPPKALDHYNRPDISGTEELCSYLKRENAIFDYFQNDEYIEFRVFLSEDIARARFTKYAQEVDPISYRTLKVWILLHDYHIHQVPVERKKIGDTLHEEYFKPVVEKQKSSEQVAQQENNHNGVGKNVEPNTGASDSSEHFLPTEVESWISQHFDEFQRELQYYGQDSAAPRADVLLHLQLISFKSLLPLFAKFKSEVKCFHDYCAAKKETYNKISADDFKYIDILGKGGFGKVVHVVKKSTGKHYAMKIQAKDRLVEQFGNMMENIEIERDVLVAHNPFPFIVSLRYAFQDAKYAFLVLDLVEGGSLRELIAKSPGFSLELPQVRLYVAEITLALERLHEHNIIYRDLKPENVLLGADGHIRLADMGLAGFYYQSKYYYSPNENSKKGKSKKGRWVRRITSHDTDCGTPLYRPPEMIKHEKYGPAVDWFQLGVFTYECLFGHLPFEAKKSTKSDEIYIPTKEEEFMCLQKKAVIPSHAGERTKSFIEGLLELDPNMRLGAGSAESGRDLAALKAHSFFWALEGALATSIDWQKVEHQIYHPVYIPCIPPLKVKAKFRNFNAARREFVRQAKKRSKDDSSDDEKHLDTIKEGREVSKHLQHYFDNWDYIHPEEVKEEIEASKRTRYRFMHFENPFHHFHSLHGLMHTHKPPASAH